MSPFCNFSLINLEPRIRLPSSSTNTQPFTVARMAPHVTSLPHSPTHLVCSLLPNKVLPTLCKCPRVQNEQTYQSAKYYNLIEPDHRRAENCFRSIEFNSQTGEGCCVRDGEERVRRQGREGYLLLDVRRINDDLSSKFCLFAHV